MKSNILQSVDLTTLTQSERCIYAYLKEHPRAILTSNLEGLCREMYISTASMVRFCQKLGFSGYNELKSVPHTCVMICSLSSLITVFVERL